MGTTWPHVNIHSKTEYSWKKTVMLCILWDQLGVVYRHDKIILLYDNDPPYVAVPRVLALPENPTSVFIRTHGSGAVASMAATRFATRHARLLGGAIRGSDRPFP
ncbi:hypothetical protein EVAR_91837_1 [Eumeta japonica]|uniref:Mariner Mos1 transposase n=1 Tax=Eumeta variegata TaxID=151549 RepID=A0A4C2A4C8_EUMVA|nr:hypothetical protein EVAR_91837_1 [Eumeta japonica]